MDVIILYFIWPIGTTDNSLMRFEKNLIVIVFITATTILKE